MVTVANPGGWACVDCGIETKPFEMYMVVADVWAQAGAGDGFLCVGCLEDRLGRVLEPDDFKRVPLNDDDELDSIRLRLRKGSGRFTEPLFQQAVRAVL